MTQISTDLNFKKIKHKELTEKISGAAYTAYNTLGWRFLEKVYENEMAIELKKMGIKGTQQTPIEVFYKDAIVSNYLLYKIIVSNHSALYKNSLAYFYRDRLGNI